MPPDNPHGVRGVRLFVFRLTYIFPPLLLTPFKDPLQPGIYVGDSGSAGC